jgi:tRNA-Thr(GGU) m(6)t(6)A37 methyltransferase TsaA
MEASIDVEPVGVVRRLSEASCLLQVERRFREALDGLQAGDEIQVLYWMHELTEAQRRELKVYPRGDRSRPLRGVFALRSPMRPNPIGVSVVRIQEVRGCEVTVSELDALDGSPLVDIKAAPARGCRPGMSGEGLT